VSFGGPLERNRAEVLAIASIAQREKDWEEQLLDLWLGYEDQRRRWRALVSAEKIDRERCEVMIVMLKVGDFL